ncbi:MAG: glycosyltransferase family 2 protein [Candidatus Moranbacteria bacterium]|nr:glycosyltransferase family 2 protein [Candidatus Moranbacteria bacterium]
MSQLISIAVPVYNEEKNIPVFWHKLNEIILSKITAYQWEVIFINDGSRDKTIEELEKLSKIDARIRIIDFSRNFGKEVALTAGLNHCRGDACLMVDADLQHPLEKIPEFLEKWEAGFEVIVGVREKNKGEGLVKRIGSYFFYKIINSIAETKITSKATDFRLLDRIVIDEFNKLPEKNRMTRALIDWLGFRRAYVHFNANPRLHGKASYSLWKLFRLAFNSFISFSLFPLRLAGYLGIIITLLSGALGLFILITKYILGTMSFSGSVILAVIILFLIGIVLICLGLIALYIANIHTEVTNRPLYIIRKSKVRI